MFAPAPSPRPTTLWISLNCSDKLLYSWILKTLRSWHLFTNINHCMSNIWVNKSCLPWLTNPLSLFYFYILTKIMHIWQCVVLHYRCDAQTTMQSPQWRWWWWWLWWVWSYLIGIKILMRRLLVFMTMLTCESSVGQEWWQVQVQADRCLGKPLQGPQSQLPGDDHDGEETEKRWFVFLTSLAR